jgi:hypothetical protein
MTVNERLFVAGLLLKWEAEIDAGHRQAAIDILCQVDMTADQAAFTVDTTMADPAKYGFPHL